MVCGVTVTEVVRRLSKPHYAFRPRQLLRRGAASSSIELPWKLPLTYEPTGFLGQALSRTGVYDLVVSEALWRLIDAGDHVIDAGANAGYMTSIMAARVGSRGRVDAFEPHPMTFQRLERNVSRWNAPVVLHNVALADRPGELPLFTVADDDQLGQASVEQREGSSESARVRAARLDDEAVGSASTMKLDVEGAELGVLKGAERTLAGLVHVIYEDHEPQPSPVTSFLQEAGFVPFVLEEHFLGPKLHRDVTTERTYGWDAPSLIATRSPRQLLARLRPRGWQCLTSKPAR